MISTMPEATRRVFHEGFVPLLKDEELWVLKGWLTMAPERFKQGYTLYPVPTPAEEPYMMPDCGCLITNIGRINMLKYADELYEYFARMCYNIDQNMGEPSAVRYLLNWYDDSPWEDVKNGSIEELEAALQCRKNKSLSMQQLKEEGV